MRNYNNIPSIKLGNLEIKLIQGGMGVGISQSGLASAVANEGGAGIIASVGLGLLKGYFEEEIRKNKDRLKNAVDEDQRKAILGKLYTQANQNALRYEIRRARSLTNGVIGVNVMYALTDYSGLAQAAAEEKVDLMITGAGPGLDFPRHIKNPRIKLLAIVSSGKAADKFCKVWSKLGHFPDAIIVEGPKAGGHLGYSREQLDDPEFVSNGLKGIIADVIQAVKIYETSQRKIPVIAAGGIFYGGDVRKFNELGAAGAQMATRFVTTYECDADDKFKQAYLDCRKEDLIIINSPVGMPGRAIANGFLRRVETGETVPVACLYHCLKTCKPDESPYCIARALVDAQQGKFGRGFVFAGANAWRTNESTGGKLLSVAEVFEDLNREYAENKRSD